MSSDETKCWICGAKANSREHLIKKSDLKAIFGKPSQEKPIFFSAGELKNKRIYGLNSDVLKSDAGMCSNCNNKRTQPHDFAWEQLYAALRRNYSPIVPGAIVRANRVFQSDTTAQMLYVHLFFVKQFGCRISEDSIPIDISSFSSSILENKAHPNVFIRFGLAAWAQRKELRGKNTSGMSEVVGRELEGRCKAASFFYHLNDLAVCITYIENNRDWAIYPNAWHPLHCRNRFVLADFLSREGIPTP